MVSRRMVRIWENGGESIRSEVSSRRCRRGGEIDAMEDGAEESGGTAGVDVFVIWGGEEFGGVNMPDSRRTVISWSVGGRR